MHLSLWCLICYLCYRNLSKSGLLQPHPLLLDRKSTRLNSSHLVISYAVFCLKKKINSYHPGRRILLNKHLANIRPRISALVGCIVSQDSVLRRQSIPRYAAYSTQLLCSTSCS